MFRSLQKVMLVKEETEYGTDPTPTVAANAIEAIDIKVNYSGEVLERGVSLKSLSPKNAVLGKRWCEVTFSCELKGSGTAGTAPRIGDLLQACGFSEGADVGSSVVYAPASTGHKSVTIYVYDIQAETGNSRLHQITGARGNVSFTFEAGVIAKAEFTMQGLAETMTDVTTPDDPTYETTDAPIVQSSAFTLNAVATLVAQSVSIDLGNEVSQREDIRAAGGLKGFLINSRKPSGSFNPEAVLALTYDFYTDWVNAAERALSLVVGSTAGNICTVTAPKLTIDGISESDRNGIRTEDIPFRLAGDEGNDELVLTFT
ncbi:MAG: phage tail tube protein [Bacteroidales bacterium]|nr:phage tail tube protein [Bacteroidales bacterium]